MGFPGVIFTDSGGFQVIRERFRPKLDDDGIDFNNPYDGGRVRVTPESIVDVQKALGSDVAMVLDDCAPFPYTIKRLALGMKRTMDWALRCRAAWGSARAADDERTPLLFAIVQGGTDRGLREKCAGDLAGIGFDGYGIGGLSIGEGSEEMLDAISWSVAPLPPEAPRYLMGVGSPVEMVNAVSRGVDIVDSVYPTRNARHGTAFAPGGTLDIRRRKWAGQQGPLDPDCGCLACRDLSVGYLYHLFDVHEITGMHLLSLHNLTYMARFTARMRTAILDGTFGTFATRVKENWVVRGGKPGSPDAIMSP